MNTSYFDSITFETLDEWLEKDLIESGIVLADKTEPIPSPSTSTMTPAQILMASPPISECTPNMGPLPEVCTPKIKYEPLSPLETPKTVPQNISNVASSIELQPFIKALSLLGSLQNQKTNTSQDIPPKQNLNKRERSLSTDEMSKEDLITLKRQRNTDAARRSRLRKALKMEALEKQVSELESENEKLRLKAAIAESEHANIEAKEKKRKVRILELERQLAEAHKALLKFNGKDTSSTTVKV